MEQPPIGAPKVEVQEQLDAIREIVVRESARVAQLGQWPSYVQLESLSKRVPANATDQAPGFDAGIACTLDLIPREAQEVSATLHANYSKAMVERVRREIAEENPNSSTMWWLAGCSVCDEGNVNGVRFLEQIEEFKRLAADETARKTAAVTMFREMTDTFKPVDGVPFGTKDGCIQGAYIAGYLFATEYSEKYGIYYIGTYEPSLGLEDFPWETGKDAKGNTTSGPVFGSKNYVKCANKAELDRALAVVKTKLGTKTED